MEEEKNLNNNEELPEELREVPAKEEKDETPDIRTMYPDDDNDLIEEPTSEDNAPVAIIYRCKKCGQILEKGAKDCWNCASKDIEEVVEEDTKEIEKVLLQSRVDRVEHELKAVKKNNDFLYVLFAIVVVLIIVFFITNR